MIDGFMTPELSQLQIINIMFSGNVSSLSTRSETPPVQVVEQKCTIGNFNLPLAATYSPKLMLLPWRTMEGLSNEL